MVERGRRGPLKTSTLLPPTLYTHTRTFLPPSPPPPFFVSLTVPPAKDAQWRGACIPRECPVFPPRVWDLCHGRGRRHRVHLGPPAEEARVHTVPPRGWAPPPPPPPSAASAATTPAPFPTSISSLAFSPTGTHLAIAASYGWEQGDPASLPGPPPPDAIFIRTLGESDVKPRNKASAAGQ